MKNVKINFPQMMIGAIIVLVGICLKNVIPSAYWGGIIFMLLLVLGMYIILKSRKELK